MEAIGASSFGAGREGAPGRGSRKASSHSTSPASVITCRRFQAMPISATSRMTVLSNGFATKAEASSPASSRHSTPTPTRKASMRQRNRVGRVMGGLGFILFIHLLLPFLLQHLPYLFTFPPPSLFFLPPPLLISTPPSLSFLFLSSFSLPSYHFLFPLSSPSYPTPFLHSSLPPFPFLSFLPLLSSLLFYLHFLLLLPLSYSSFPSLFSYHLPSSFSPLSPLPFFPLSPFFSFFNHHLLYNTSIHFPPLSSFHFHLTQSSHLSLTFPLPHPKNSPPTLINYYPSFSINPFHSFSLFLIIILLPFFTYPLSSLPPSTSSFPANFHMLFNPTRAPSTRRSVRPPPRRGRAPRSRSGGCPPPAASAARASP
jgi:hypothetical protein